MHMHNAMQLYEYRCMYMLNEMNCCVQLLCSAAVVYRYVRTCVRYVLYVTDMYI